MRESEPQSNLRDGRFLSTAWSLIKDAQNGNGTLRTEALDRLASVYWRPIYWTIRLEWNANPDDARDLTQDYFTMLIETDLLGQVSPDLGRFRAFVKATIRNFMLRHRRSGQAIKRGGGRKLLALGDVSQIEAEGPMTHEDPTQAFDRELMKSIIHASLVALEAQARRDGKKSHYDLFVAYYGEEKNLSYQDLQQSFKLGPHEVKNRLAQMRVRFRQLVLGFLRDGVSSESELLGELGEVFSR